jgi:hypothetical protein
MSSNDEDGIYKIDTVPPPAGENDAYSAPTRVGPMASAVVEEIIAQAKREAQEAASSRPPNGTADDESVVIDPAQLLTVEALSARLDAALRTPSLPQEMAPGPTGLAPDEDDEDDVDFVESPGPIPVAQASEPSVRVAPSAPPSVPAQPKPRSSATGTFALFALVLLLAAIGYYLLRLRH